MEPAVRPSRGAARASAAPPGWARRLLLVWLGVQLLVLPALAVLLRDPLGDLLAVLLTRLPYPHGLVKFVLESSQGLLLNQRALAAGLPLAALAGLVPRPASPGLHRWIAALLALASLVLACRFAHWPALLALPLMVLAGEPEAGWARRLWPLAYVPFAPALLPSAAASALALPRPARRALATLSCITLFATAAWSDCLAGYGAVRAGLERWPDALLDPRLRVLAHSPPGVRADWHGVQIVGDHAIVVGEDRPRLLAFPLDPGRPVVEHSLGPRWGRVRAAPLDADTDPSTGLTWVISGEQSMSELRWTGEAFTPVRRLDLPAPIDYAYVRRWADRLMFVSVQTAGPSPRTVIEGRLPALDDLRAVQLRRSGPGEPLPMPREAVYVPELDRLALAPDFGERLFLADLATGLATPWIETPTLDGKMIYQSDLKRVVLALPNRFELWFIDPVAGAVDWSVPTQPGVRAVAVDARRGLLVTASVLTGQIWVQDLRSGEVCDRFGTVMPMARELALSPERGEAVLTTWVAVYQLDYTCGRPLPPLGAP